MEKLTKKNSIIFNQLWINKVIEEGRMNLLPSKLDNGMSIGEYLESKYEEKENDSPKITKNNSYLFEREWKKKILKENIKAPKHKTEKYSIGELCEIKYNEIQLFKENNKEKCLELKQNYFPGNNFK